MAASYKKLFKLLIDREMKSKELAYRAGISSATLAKMKKDGATVSSDVLIKICMALGCTLDDIVEIIPEEKAKAVVSEATVFKLGELFCGPGGIACGAMRAKSADGKLTIEHAWANDYDEDTCKTYIRNICPNAPETVHCGDVRELDKNLPVSESIQCFGVPWFKKYNKEWIEKIAGCFRNVIENHEQLLELEDEKKKKGGRWHGFVDHED